jgi:hypothetical protein
MEMSSQHHALVALPLCKTLGTHRIGGKELHSRSGHFWRREKSLIPREKAFYFIN